MIGLALASALVLTVPSLRTAFYRGADAWLEAQRGHEALAVRMELAQAADRGRVDPQAAVAITSAVATRMRRRGGFWTPLEALALEGSAAAARDAGNLEAELTARRALLRLQPGRLHRRAELGDCLVRMRGRQDEGLEILRDVFARDPNSLTALLPLVQYELANGKTAAAKRLVARYERAPLLPQSMVAASRLNAVRLLDRQSRPVGGWRCAPPIDGRPHLLRFPLAGNTATDDAGAVTITITVGPSCGRMTLHHLELVRVGGAEPIRLSGTGWPTMEVVGGNRAGPDRIVIHRERIRVGFRLPRPVPVTELNALELRLTLHKRFPSPLDTLRSKRP